MVFFIIGFCILILILILMFFQSYRYTITRTTIPLANLPSVFEGIRVLFISDIHRRELPNTILSSIKKEHLDYVFIGGDLIEKNVPMERARRNVQFLTSIGKTYFVWGNHDVKTNKRKLATLLKQSGVTILENDAVLLNQQHNHRLWLLGVGDVCSKQDNLGLSIKSIHKANSQKDVRILISHVPTITKKIKQEHRIALVLSGHTHGGQIALPWIGPITGGVGELFPKQVQGLYDLDKTMLYISSGFGTSHYPLRLFTTPEVAILTLKRVESQDTQS